MIHERANVARQLIIAELEGCKPRFFSISKTTSPAHCKTLARGTAKKERKKNPISTTVRAGKWQSTTSFYARCYGSGLCSISAAPHPTGQRCPQPIIPSSPTRSHSGHRPAGLSISTHALSAKSSSSSSSSHTPTPSPTRP